MSSFKSTANPDTSMHTSLPGIQPRDYFAWNSRQEALQDECFTPTGEVRESWQRLLRNAEKLGAEEINTRQGELLKLLQENGVTYNVYGDPGGINRPWQLDAMPLLINTGEMGVIEKGMKQRAHVLDLLLKDLYGERKILKEGVIPAELIYAHSGFLRPCDGIVMPGAHQLILYAADLSRGPDGKIWVLKDRTQAPSGMGYALENRKALNRVFPELFREYTTTKLGGFFNNMMHSFLALAPKRKDQPRLVLLTPGPRNETYFEHAFLASFLGLTLVQGDDLVARDGYVWIKTVEGLEKVDVILRRVDDHFCDPLELKEDSQLGVPGLLEVVRNGNVAVANPLGSGILENSGIMAFMHNVFRYYLKEDPIFPMRATWWCGQKKEMDYVIERLDELVIKKIDRAIGSGTVMGSRLSKAQKEELISQIRAKPFLYTGLEEVGLSTSPVWEEGKLEPRYTVIRSFVVASPTGYDAMPGGLTRCSAEKGSFLVSNQAGGIAKDTWVEVPPPPQSPALIHASDLKRKSVLPSRAAENLFWVGRYSQRVLRSSRFVRIVLRSLLQNGSLNAGVESPSLRALLKTLTHITGTYPGFLEMEELTLEKCLTEIHQLVCVPEKNGGVLQSVNQLLKAMYAVRDRWPVDNWRIIDDIENVKERVASLEPQAARLVFGHLDHLNGNLLSFLEMNRQSMYRGEGWTIYRIGQVVEEILFELAQYRSLLAFQLEEGDEFQVLEALLLSSQNLTSYRSVYRTFFDLAPALDLLFFNKQNPSSLLSQLSQLRKYTDRLPQKEKASGGDEITGIVFECYSLTRLMNVIELMKTDDESGFRKTLDGFCEQVITKMTLLSSRLTSQYFSHSQYRVQGAASSISLEV